MASRIPKIKQESNKMSIKTLVGKRMTKKVKFLNEDIIISKLSVSQVTDIQVVAKEVEAADDADTAANFRLLQQIIKAAVDEADDLSDEDFNGFPLDELSKLSGEIMKFSGMGAEVASKKGNG